MMTKSVQRIAYKYGMELAARDAGYQSLNQFAKQAYAVPGALIGAGVGAGVGALSDSDNRFRGAAIGGVGGAALGGLGGHLLGRSNAKSKDVIEGAGKSIASGQNAAKEYDAAVKTTDVVKSKVPEQVFDNAPEMSSLVPEPAAPQISKGRMETMSAPGITLKDQIKGLGQYGVEQGQLGLAQLKAHLMGLAPSNRV